MPLSSAFADKQMKLEMILSSKPTARIQIVSAAASGIFLLIATWISTLQIPSIQEMVNSEDSSIRELRDQVTNDLIFLFMSRSNAKRFK